ncbi:MAG: cellulase family glycosylhydrolase [Anaerolineae bacterium]|nr:cellulase family glycosylhydrolase [Anaerolineae bacterium]
MFNKRSLRFLAIVPVLILTLLLLGLSPKPAAQAEFGDRITVSGGQFMAGGQRIWINGANTPWNNWNDFGGSYNASWWDSHFQQLHDNGVNATRVWITCSGEVGINISEAGYVSGATDKHWQDLDSFFQIAQDRQIYIMATLISFDHFKDTYSTYTRWRNMIQSNNNIDSYVTNYVIPFVNRYESNPYLWSIDLINEPDWVYENAEVGQLPWDYLQEYWARSARAIHENSPVLVTVGMGMPKYNSSCPNGCEGNVIADSVLRAKVNDPDVYIDFYSSHYYPWQDPYFGGIPFYKSPAEYYGADPGKPCMIGETPGTGSTDHTLTEDYENAYLNGWQGVMPWTSNGVDSNGGFDQLVPATNAFLSKHPELVFPGGDYPTLTPTRTPTTGPSPTPTQTPGGAVCSPVNATISAPFSHNGTGTFCWQSNNLGAYVNSWNLAKLTINGVDFTNTYVSSSSYPAQINGYWYVSYISNVAWGHFEAAGTGGPTSTPVVATNTPVVSTPTRTNTPVVVTATPTLTNTPVMLTATPTSGGGACSPVDATITAPFTQNGAGTFCWQSNNLGAYVNSWNLASLTINGVDYTNTYVPVGSLPAKIGGYWYIAYTGNYPWSHFEAK